MLILTCFQLVQTWVLGLEHSSGVEGVFAASVRIADHVVAESRSICTFLHKYLSLIQLVKSSAQCVQNTGLYLMGVVIKSWHFCGGGKPFWKGEAKESHSEVDYE